ncbi:MAG TPA: sugar transferase [Anaerolineaceae bacterium]|nr:sugar transferase [Anaerolineaceae bacterium]HQN05015.1 sugar transferase [Anaerolineaceae bacterium]
MAKLIPAGIPVSKRICDLVLTLLGLVILSPFLVILIVLVWVNHGKPVFFRQVRPGYKAQPFRIFKFRTMRDLYGSDGNLLPDAERLTPFGRFMRSFSLDELPELLNVLLGDMSLVGPRPLLMSYLPRYSAEQMRRHDVIPGMTGWAQVNGRNVLSWPKRLQMDVWYVDNWSFWLDVKILFMTVIKVLKKEGISEPGQATVSEFMGTEEQ